jgi:predicted Zn-dependent peptidase
MTALLAFEAGSRTERADENGIAHFLEHLVFKGGEKYRTYREVNETGERIGARVGAYTGNDLVAFYATARAEAASEALDLLTDFVGRPRLDPDELERERGVVIQEIARALDRPADLADLLIDRAAFGEHPLGRPILGSEERLRAFTRDAVVEFQRRNWSTERGGAFLVGNLSGLPVDNTLAELFGRFAPLPPPKPFEPAPPPSPRTVIEGRDSKQSHLRLMYRAAIDVRDPRARAALTVFNTLLGGSPGSLLFDEIREQRGLAYSVYAREHCHADAAIVQLATGLESSKCVEAYRRMRTIVSDLRDRGPSAEHVERARAYAAGRRVLAFENTMAAASHAAKQAILFGELVEPDAAIASLDSVTYAEVASVARQISDPPAVACVGPVSADAFA